MLVRRKFRRRVPQACQETASRSKSGSKHAEEKFKTVSAAYGLLSDPEKRAQFDRGEIGVSGQERQQHRYYRDFAGAAAGDHPYATSEGFSDFADEGDVFSSLFGRGVRFDLKMRGQD